MTLGRFAWGRKTAEELGTEGEGATFVDGPCDDLVEFVGVVVATGEAGHAEADDAMGFGTHIMIIYHRMEPNVLK